MKILYLSDLDKHGHHVYEFSYNANYDKHWNTNSLYVDDNDFGNSLGIYIDKVFENFHYYGPQKVLISEWEKIKNLAVADSNHSNYFLDFFQKIEEWKRNDPEAVDFFWIKGV